MPCSCIHHLRYAVAVDGDGGAAVWPARRMSALRESAVRVAASDGKLPAETMAHAGGGYARHQSDASSAYSSSDDREYFSDDSDIGRPQQSDDGSRGGDSDSDSDSSGALPRTQTHRMFNFRN
eukprot:SAG31_NODE_4087_length_3601_cov_3.169903_4_plen_123_part_00